jgi:hypothetical protein
MAIADDRSMAFQCGFVLELREEAFELGLHRNLQQLPSAPAQKVGQRVTNRVSTREFDDVIFFLSGASSMVGGRVATTIHPDASPAFKSPEYESHP